jgi:hypothetical protein
MRVYAVAAAAVVLLLVLRVRRTRRIAKARELARGLIPEIRTLMASCEGGGAPAAGDPPARERLSTTLSKEAAFAVEAFYQSVDEYADASREMFAAFADESELSLGDKVRAKDRRDRTLKDVYYSGEGALERLKKLS